VAVSNLLTEASEFILTEGSDNIALSITPLFFGVATNPSDEGSVTEPQTGLALTPPSSMAANDLVVVFQTAQGGANNDGKAINNDGGQVWTTDNEAGSYSYVGSPQSVKIYWCIFNGTWDANPSWDFPNVTGTQAASLQMLVFRPHPPPLTDNPLWGLDQPNSWATYSDPDSPYTVSITGRTPSRDHNISIAYWTSDDDNTWGSLSGTNWEQTGLSSQYRNSGGTNHSVSFAYQLQDGAAGTNNVAQNQATAGPDQGATGILTFYSYDSADILLFSLLGVGK
jgi:hypothetical protein|tara:strand:- start:1141 stop:1986 length:846 start_codon:yes stop_codon:yes gene_type:complete